MYHHAFLPPNYPPPNYPPPNYLDPFRATMILSLERSLHETSRRLQITADALEATRILLTEVLNSFGGLMDGVRGHDVCN